ncbi:MAG TPA: methyltransferase [Vicinamibacterales bacterium]
MAAQKKKPAKLSARNAPKKAVKKSVKKPAGKSSKKPLAPDHILQLGLGFWGSRTLLTAIELGVFTELGKGPSESQALRRRLGLHERSAHDFFDALVALGLLRRKGTTYTNTPETEVFLDRAKPSYIGGILEMAGSRLYGFWGSLTEGLRTGQPQNEVKHGSDNPFATLYADPDRLRQFLSAMSGISMGAAIAIARKFPWKNHKTFVDIGGAQGCLSVQIALAHKHLRGGEFDLTPVGPIYEDYVKSFGLEGRLTFQAGDFFNEPMPSADVLIMGHILHDWGLEDKLALLKKAYDALPKGGALIVYEAIIDDDRSKNAFGLLMSLNMLIETPAGFDYSGADCIGWMKKAGFRKTFVEHLVGPDSMVVGIK